MGCITLAFEFILPDKMFRYFLDWHFSSMSLCLSSHLSVNLTDLCVSLLHILLSISQIFVSPFSTSFCQSHRSLCLSSPHLSVNLADLCVSLHIFLSISQIFVSRFTSLCNYHFVIFYDQSNDNFLVPKW